MGKSSTAQPLQPSNREPESGVFQLPFRPARRAAARRPSLLARLDDQTLKLICEAIFGDGYGRADLARFSQTCKKLYYIVQPHMIYRELRTQTNNRAAIRPDDKFPELNIVKLIFTLYNNKYLASLVETINFRHERRGSEAGKLGDIVKRIFDLDTAFDEDEESSDFNWERTATYAYVLLLMELHDGRWSSDDCFVNINVVRTLLFAAPYLQQLTINEPGYYPVGHPALAEQRYLPNVTDLALIDCSLWSVGLEEILQACNQLTKLTIAFTENRQINDPVGAFKAISSHASTLGGLLLTSEVNHRYHHLGMLFTSERVMSPGQFPILERLVIDQGLVLSDYSEHNNLVRLIQACLSLKLLSITSITEFPTSEIAQLAASGLLGRSKLETIRFILLWPLTRRYRDNWDNLLSFDFYIDMDKWVARVIEAANIQLKFRTRHWHLTDPDDTKDEEFARLVSAQRK
ncbi:hypothetical protein OQA88_11254 [Cercophora sp. LCS_1]